MKAQRQSHLPIVQRLGWEERTVLFAGGETPSGSQGGVSGTAEDSPTQPQPLSRLCLPPLGTPGINAAVTCISSRFSSTPAAFYDRCIAARAAWPTASHCETADFTYCSCVRHLGEAILGLLFVYQFSVGCSTQMSESPANSDHFMISFHILVTLCYGHLCFSSKFI